MVDKNKLAHIVLEHAEEISALKESAKSAHKRIDNLREVTDGIHKIAANMESLVAEVKRLGERLEDGLREQGKRLGQTETAIISLENLRTKVEYVYGGLNDIKLEPAKKWNKAVWKVMSLLITAVAMYFLGKYT
jgi:uncharacterized coiled-coil DUF342 family protein